MMPALVLALLACQVGPDTGDTDTSDTSVTSPDPQAPIQADQDAHRGALSPHRFGTPNLGDCGPDEGDSAEPVVVLAGALSPWMPTVIHVTWTGVAGEVHYDDGRVERIAPAHESDDGYETWLIGPTAGSSVDFWLVYEDGETCSDTETLTTGDLVVPALTGLVETPSTLSPVDGLVLVSWFGDPSMEHSLRSGMALLNRDGEGVWMASALEGYRIAAASWTTSGVWTLQEAEVGTTEPNLIVWVGADGQLGPIESVQEAHHDLVVFPDGQPGWLETDVREVEGLGPVGAPAVAVVGDRFVKLGADGLIEPLWEAWTELSVRADSLTWDKGYYGTAKDWTHANGLGLNDAGDTVLISLLGVATVLEVDVVTGAILRSLESVLIEDETTRFSALHSPTWSGVDKIKAFINADGAGTEASYAVEFDLSLDPPVEVWNSGREDTVHYSHALGRVAHLSAEHTLINYGQESVLEEVDLAGDVVWRWGLTSEWVLGESGVVTLWEE
jgi:hypothetical protein